MSYLLASVIWLARHLMSLQSASLHAVLLYEMSARERSFGFLQRSMCSAYLLICNCS